MFLLSARLCRSLKTFSATRAQIHRLQVQFDAAGFKGGNREQILDQQIEPVGVAFDDSEEMLGHFGIVARAVEQCFHVPLDERKGRTQFMADVGHKFLARAFELLEPGQIVKDQDSSFTLPAELEITAALTCSQRSVKFRSFEFVVKNLFFSLSDADQFVQFVQAQRLQDGFAAQFDFEPNRFLNARLAR